MQLTLTIQLLLFLFLWTGCKSKKQPTASDSGSNTTTKTYYTQQTVGTNSSPIEVDKLSYFGDGIYCADVRYSNSNTSTASIYKLSVEVEDGKLVKIRWPNGGWLDESHFTAPHIAESGFASFTSDQGYEYDVLIKSRGICDYTANSFNSYSDSRSSYTEDEEEDEEARLENEYGSVRATVYKRVSGCDYMILEERGDYYVVEWMGGYDPDEGEQVQGDLRCYGTKTCYVCRRDRESRLYVEEYRVSLSEAWETIREKCDLAEEKEDQ